MSVLNLLIGGVQLVAGIVLTASGIGGGLGLKLILSGALSLISSFMSAKAGRGGISSSPTYGFDNLSNSAREGGPVPIIYGRHITTPPVINLNPIQDGESQILWMLFLLGEGEIDSVESAYLNGTLSTRFPGVELDSSRKGTASQLAFPQFTQVGTGYDYGTALGLNVTSQHDMRQECDEAAVMFVWPSGFYKQRSDGGADESNVGIGVEYRAVTATGPSGWIPFPAPGTTAPTSAAPWYGTGTAGIFKTRGQSRSAVRKTLRLKFDGLSGRPAKGRYSIRITGLADNNANIWAPTVASVVEVVSLSTAYANCALLQVKCPAVAQLGTSLPRVSAVVKGLKVYDPRSATTTWSDNPALCVRDLLLSTRYGLGHWITSDMIDDGVGGSWRTVADACDVLVALPGTTATEKRHRLNYVLDVKNSATDYLTEMLNVFRATMFAADGLIRISRDTTGTTNRHFEDTAGAAATVRRNVQHEMGENGYSDRSLLTAHVLEDSQRWNVVRATYIDNERDWGHRTLELRNRSIAIGAITGTYVAGETIRLGPSGPLARFVFQRGGVLYYVQDDGAAALSTGLVLVGQTSGASATTAGDPVTSEAPERALEINLFGATYRSQVIREMRFHLNRALMTPILTQIPMGPGDIDLLPGDVIDVSSDFPGAWSSKLFTTLSLGFGQDGRGALTAREYNADVYVDTVDTMVIPVGGNASPGGMGTSGTPSTPTTPGSTGSTAGGAGGSGGTGGGGGAGGGGTFSGTAVVGGVIYGYVGVHV